MKANIDLTEKRDFASNVSLQIKKVYKYLDIKTCLAIDIGKDKSILQGDKHERKLKQVLNNQENTCARCGRENKYPYKKNSWYLCEDCERIVNIANKENKRVFNKLYY